MGEQVADDLSLVATNGIPFGKVPDLQKYLQNISAQHPEIEHVVLQRNANDLFASKKRDFDLGFGILVQRNFSFKFG